MTIGRKIILGFSFAILVPILLGMMNYFNSNKLVETTWWVSHTHEVLARLEGILSQMKDLESSQLYFAITGNAVFLEAFGKGKFDVEESKKGLRNLTKDNPQQQQNLVALEKLIDERVKRMEFIVTTRQGSNLTKTADEVSTLKGAEIMNNVRNIILTMEDLELELLDKRRKEAESASEMMSLATVWGIIMAIIVMSLIALAIVRSITVPVRLVVSQLAATSSELLAGSTEQATGAQEQAVAVAQTVTTVDEVTQTANQSAQGAKALGEKIQKSLEVGKIGRKVVEDSLQATSSLKKQVEGTAQNILNLANQAQSIGDIIATVTDIAEQINLLSLNAAIEASRAGEQGRGFAVVANEVKSLADLSKKSTQQIRQILGEIQKATNTTVISIEEVTKGVTSAAKAVDQSGQTIQNLGEALGEAAQVGVQITASSGQQAMGMSQIHQAMKNLDQVAKQNMAATRQAEQSARNLTDLGHKLAALTGH